jgi:hypothetical protein
MITPHRADLDVLVPRWCAREFTSRLSAPGSGTGTGPAISITGARHGSLLVGALTGGELATARDGVAGLAGAEFGAAVFATGDSAGLAGTVNAALLPGESEGTGRDEPVARVVG